MRKRRIRPPCTLLASLAVAAILASCSSLPLPATIDLKAKLGEAASGSVSERITAGDAGDIAFKHPSDEGACLDLSDVDIPVKVESARLHYDVELRYRGPDLTGRVAGQLYASAEASDLWRAPNKVGPRVTLNLDKARTRLAGSAVLHPEQLDAINDRWLCWGVQVSGKDVSATETGEATITYVIHDLRLSIRFSVL